MSTAICRSFENQRSVTTLIGFRLPIWPAGIVVVDRVPSAVTPSICRVPSDSTTSSDADCRGRAVELVASF